ncbi:MAG: dual specificity protein phosphatase family protein [Proteobacteria bacterium]|nr:dual specificity protein phosphatase family protein [Pseudomonadota bacterium]
MAFYKELKQRIEFVVSFYTGTLLPELNPNIQHWNEIISGLFLGAMPIATSFWGMGNHGEKIRAQCKAQGRSLKAVYSVVNLWEALGEGLGLAPVSPKYWTDHKVSHRLIPCDDFGGNLDIDEVKQIVDEMNDLIKNNKSVYIHCKAGKGRSFALAVCYLLAHTDKDVTQIFGLLRHKRHQVSPNENQYELIEKFRAKYCPMKAPLNRNSLHFQSYRKDLIHRLKSPLMQAVLLGVAFGVTTGLWLMASTLAMVSGITSKIVQSFYQKFENNAYQSLNNVYSLSHLSEKELKAVQCGIACTTWRGWVSNLTDVNATWYYSKYRGGLRLSIEKEKLCENIPELIAEKQKTKPGL